MYKKQKKSRIPQNAVIHIDIQGAGAVSLDIKQNIPFIRLPLIHAVSLKKKKMQENQNGSDLNELISREREKTITGKQCYPAEGARQTHYRPLIVPE